MDSQTQSDPSRERGPSLLESARLSTDPWLLWVFCSLHILSSYCESFWVVLFRNKWRSLKSFASLKSSPEMGQQYSQVHLISWEVEAVIFSKSLLNQARKVCFSGTTLMIQYIGQKWPDMNWGTSTCTETAKSGIWEWYYKRHYTDMSRQKVLQSQGGKQETFPGTLDGWQ